MSRAVWFLAGAGAGAYALQRARRAAETFTPEGLRDRLAGWHLGARMFLAEVRAGQAEAEQDVRTRLGLSATPGATHEHAPAAPPAGARRELTTREKRDRP